MSEKMIQMLLSMLGVTPVQVQEVIGKVSDAKRNYDEQTARLARCEQKLDALCRLLEIPPEDFQTTGAPVRALVAEVPQSEQDQSSSH